jgi:hypothetical protein
MVLAINAITIKSTESTIIFIWKYTIKFKISKVKEGSEKGDCIREGDRISERESNRNTQ